MEMTTVCGEVIKFTWRCSYKCEKEFSWKIDAKFIL